MPNLAETLGLAARRLRKAGSETPELDARLLVAAALQVDRSFLLLQHQREVSDNELEKIEDFIQRREKHEPVSRILGTREFWSLSFGLNEATLDPRPDSETLIDAALALHPDRRVSLRILDLGTGTGCLLLALLSEFPKATGIGTDCAEGAIRQARANAENFGLNNRARFLCTNWAEGVDGPFDLVISNPPYIPSGDIPTLMPDVRDYDPRAALDGGPDGLMPYRLIAEMLPALLTPDGHAVLEVGTGQASDVQKIFSDAGSFAPLIRRDLSGVERCVIVQSP